MWSMRRRVLAMAALVWVATLAMATIATQARAQADAWPVQPIKIIVPFAAGGATDVLARVLTDKLSAALKQAVIAENRPGAGSTLGAAQAALAKPDGHTLMMLSTSHLFAPALYKDLPYDALTSFVPIARLTSGAFVLVVNPAVPASTVKEFVALAKAQPGKLNYASSGAGGNQHLITQMFLGAAGIDVKHVPYKGSAPALTDLVGGQVQMGFMATTNALAYVKAGKLRALAVTSVKRTPEMPDVPSLDESGVAGFEATAWLGMAAPKGTPQAVVARLDGELRKIMAQPDIQKQLIAAGHTPDFLGAKEFEPYLRSESVKWLKLARSLNLQE